MMARSTLPFKVISGGQTGVDRAALDAALACRLPLGGWCPKNRRTEDGVLDSKYPLRETQSVDYADRTRFNVRDSDGTLILASGRLTGGTALTKKLARQYERPLLVIDPEDEIAVESIRGWLIAKEIKTLNIAGPRERNRPHVYEKAFNLLCHLFSESMDKAMEG